MQSYTGMKASYFSQSSFWWPAHLMSDSVQNTKVKSWCHAGAFSLWKSFQIQFWRISATTKQIKMVGFPKKATKKIPWLNVLHECSRHELYLQPPPLEPRLKTVPRWAVAPLGAKQQGLQEQTWYVLTRMGVFFSPAQLLTDTTNSLNLKQSHRETGTSVCLKHIFSWWFLKTVWKTLQS